MSGEVEQFWKLCFNFAYYRCWNKYTSEEFAQEAYIYKFKRNWLGTLAQFWAHYLRSDLGAIGFAKWRVKRAIDYREITRFKHSSHPLNVVEECIAAPYESPRITLKCLDMREQMIVILLEAGFTRKDISESFGHMPTCVRKCFHSIQEKFVSSPEVEEVLEKNTSNLVGVGVGQKLALKARQRSSEQFSSSEIELPDLL